VASFVGDVNVFRARLESIDGTKAMVAVGTTRLTVPAAPLAGMTPGAAVDLFVRPEDLHVATDGMAALTGTVAAQVYQGGHVDLSGAAPEPRPGRILLRPSGREASARYAAGTRVTIAIVTSEAVAFQ